MGERSAQRAPVLFRHLAAGDGDIPAHARLAHFQIVKAVVEPAVAPHADSEKRTRAVVKGGKLDAVYQRFRLRDDRPGAFILRDIFAQPLFERYKHPGEVCAVHKGNIPAADNLLCADVIPIIKVAAVLRQRKKRFHACFQPVKKCFRADKAHIPRRKHRNEIKADVRG